jgi:lysophospholipase L1-like esterase
VSNAFGTEPLEIGAAHIAIRDEGAAIQPESDRELTFSGEPSISIPPGALVLSDPVALDVPALGDLAVSIYLPTDTGVPTAHLVARQTNYVSSEGDFTAHPDATPFHQMDYPSWYFLAGVEVKPLKPSSAIVTLGDSITDGYCDPALDENCIPDKNSRWPDELARRLQAHHFHMAVLNAGIAGNRILHDYPVLDPSDPLYYAIYGVSALARFDRDVLAQTGVSHMIVLEGINDIGIPVLEPPTAVTPEEIISGLKQLIERAHVRGIKVFGGTLLPFEGFVFFTPEGEAMRQAVNHWIRTSGAFDGVIDFDEALRDPDQPTRLLPEYDSGDHAHPNDIGYKAMGEAIDLKMFKGRHHCYR